MMYVFLLLSMLSGVLEIGVVLMSYSAGRELWASLLMAAMYQLGNLLSVPGKWSRKTLLKLEWGNVFLFVIGLCCENRAAVTVQAATAAVQAAAVTVQVATAAVQAAVATVQVAVASLCIQTVRAEQKAACPAWLKRTFRIGGFALAPLMAGHSRIILLLCAVLPLLFTLSGKTALQKEARETAGSPAKRDGAGGRRRYSAVMIFHQMHYFVYTYVVLLTAVKLSGSLYAGAAFYALSWISYLIPQWAVERRETYRPAVVFFVCHTGLAVTMGLLTAAFLTENVWLGLAAWLLTGLGGGSVFCIRRLVPERESCDIAASENIGHFLGTALAAAIAAAGCGAGAVFTGISCAFVILALSAAAAQGKKKRRAFRWRRTPAGKGNGG